MTKRAIVIGIESYPGLDPRAVESAKGKDATHAVADAIAFHEWLVGPAGVDAGDVSLHLSPAERHPAAKTATADAIQVAVAELRAAGERTTERLYFFYAGHGFTFGTGMSAEPEAVLVCADFRSVEWSGNKTYRVGEILSVLRGLGPGEQYFFLDCCRSLVTPEKLSVGTLGINLKPAVNGAPSQCTLWSTSPGRAAVSPSPFVAALVDGLRGKGASRAWLEDELVVSFESLAKYVGQRMEAETDQEPSPNVTGRFPAPLLKVYPPPPLAEERCEVVVAGVHEADTVTVCAYRSGEKKKSARLPGGRGALTLVPAKYSLVVETEEYAVSPPRCEIDAFEPSQAHFTARWGGVREPATFTRTLGLEAITVAEPLHVRFDLPGGEATVRLVDEAGRTHAGVGAGAMTLRPGTYRVAIEEAGLVVHEETQAIERGRRGPLTVALPPPADPTRAAFFQAVGSSGGWVMPSEALGPVADQSLSLWLSLLAAQAVYRGFDKLSRIPTVELPAVGQAGAALVVLSAGPTRPDLAILSAGARGAVPLTPSAAIPALWEGALAIPPGSHLVGWGGAALALHALPDRAACLVIVEEPGARPSATLLSFPLAGRGAGPGVHPLVFTRWLEHAARAFARRQPFAGPRFAAPDPIYDLLAAHAALREGRPAEAEALAIALEAAFPGMPDVAALRALLGATPGVEAPPTAGIPMVLDGALALHPSGEIPGGPPAHAIVWGSPWTRWSERPGHDGGDPQTPGPAGHDGGDPQTPTRGAGR